MKTLTHFLDNTTTEKLLILCFITMVIGAAIGAALLTATGRLKIHPSIHHSSELATNPKFPEVVSVSAETPPASAAGTTNPRVDSPVSDNGSQTAGTVLIHGTLSGSVKPPEDRPWRHWLN